MTRRRTNTSTSTEFGCDGCGRPEKGPMLRDDIWQQIAAAGEHEFWLCGGCMGQRAEVRLGRMLAFADLWPCAFNLFQGPYENRTSWFDVFAVGAAPATDVDEWRTAAKILSEWRDAGQLIEGSRS